MWCHRHNILVVTRSSAYTLLFYDHIFHNLLILIKICTLLIIHPSYTDMWYKNLSNCQQFYWLSDRYWNLHLCHSVIYSIKTPYDYICLSCSMISLTNYIFHCYNNWNHCTMLQKYQVNMTVEYFSSEIWLLINYFSLIVSC